jgi:hypothetical protein
MENSITTRANIYTLIFKNGKIKIVGGVHPFMVMLKLILKKLIQNHLNYPISMAKQNQQSKR